MKKVLFTITAIIAFSTFSCTPNSIAEEDEANTTIQSIDKDKICPPNDRNCNGIPDSQE